MKEGENGTRNDMNNGGKVIICSMYVPFPPTYHLSRGSFSQSLAVDELNNCKWGSNTTFIGSGRSGHRFQIGLATVPYRSPCPVQLSAILGSRGHVAPVLPLSEEFLGIPAGSGFIVS